MPRIGTPSSSSSAGKVGAPSSLTLFGPPDRIKPLGFAAATTVGSTENGWISQ